MRKIGLLSNRKYRVTLKCESHDSYRAKSPSGGSHCGGMESCRLCDPPQAENPASQDLGSGGNPVQVQVLLSA